MRNLNKERNPDEKEKTMSINKIKQETRIAKGDQRNCQKA